MIFYTQLLAPCPAIALAVLFGSALSVYNFLPAADCERLQEAGLIRYHRGQIAVLDRPGLEQRVCECYAVVKRESDRLLQYDDGQGKA